MANRSALIIITGKNGNVRLVCRKESGCSENGMFLETERTEGELPSEAIWRAACDSLPFEIVREIGRLMITHRANHVMAYEHGTNEYLHIFGLWAPKPLFDAICRLNFYGKRIFTVPLAGNFDLSGESMGRCVKDAVGKSRQVLSEPAD